MATSTRANASSPANISPVGPPPAITTACFAAATRRSDSSCMSLLPLPRFLACGRRLCGTARGLPQVPASGIRWKSEGPLSRPDEVDSTRARRGPSPGSRARWRRPSASADRGGERAGPRRGGPAGGAGAAPPPARGEWARSPVLVGLVLFRVLMLLLALFAGRGAGEPVQPLERPEPATAGLTLPELAR